MKRASTAAIYGLSAIIGLMAFAYPLLLPQLSRINADVASETNRMPAGYAPALTMVLVMLCLGILLVELHGQAVNGKVVAALGILIAAASVLRFLETAIPGPGGFSPIFAPIILAGYVFGARFGFLMGAMTLLTSALLTAGVGPWLPYQMFVGGWVGMTAGWMPHLPQRRAELGLLTGFAFLWGLLFGAILNLYFWPFFAGDVAMSWQSGMDFADGVARYSAFYLTTSFAWDLIRAFGNALLVLALGIPVIRALERFRDRFRFELV